MKNILLLLTLILFTMTTSYAQQKPTTSGYAPVNGLKLYYETYGEGTPLVLIHGSFMNIGMNWGQLIPALSKSHKVIALEMQGHGRTADIDRAYSYEGLAGDVAGLLNYLNIKQADVVGYSLGGTIAYQLAIAHPEMIKKLIIISGVYKTAGWLPQVQQAIKGLTPETLAQTPLKQAYDALAPDPSHWAAFIKKLMILEGKDFDLGDDHIKHLPPTLLIMGDNDGSDLQYTAHTYHLMGGGVCGDLEGLPKSQLAILPGVTHVSLMMETAKLTGLILPFIDK
ncbi:alpha/beta fold hydrolase [Chitinophaga qingshengii]|nr:alpha/beta hydrolase [Chitinophaga qingshengii]